MLEQRGPEAGTRYIHDDVDVVQSVIPGLTRNPVFSWIPAFAGMPSPGVINDAVYKWGLV
jgi:hypothetical protein